MHIDFVCPKDNEEELLRMAASLGYSGICFCYAFSKFQANKEKILVEINKLRKENKSIKIYSAIIFEESNVPKLNSLSKSSKEIDFVILTASKNSRFILERYGKKIDYLLNSENLSSKDSFHYRKSGLNQVVCRLLKENDVKLLISFNNFLTLENNEFSTFTGRVKQNIKFARKYKIQAQLGSFAKDGFELRSKHDLIALLIVLGMHPKEAKNAFMH